MIPSGRKEVLFIPLVYGRSIVCCAMRTGCPIFDSFTNHLGDY